MVSNGFVNALLDSAGKSDTEATNQLTKLLSASNAAVRGDGSVEFKDVSPAAVAQHAAPDGSTCPAAAT